MSISTPTEAPPTIDYPDGDGEPMAENTLQFEWIVAIKLGLDIVFRDDPNVFVGGDLLWYPVEGDNKTRMAPDAMVAFGRPKGYRGSYMQWREGGIAPQVVFEVLSPGNRVGEMLRKSNFYARYGVEEYYLYDPDSGELLGWLREGQFFREIAQLSGWVSPRLNVRFELTDGTLVIRGPEGQAFASYEELTRQPEEARRRIDEERRLRAESDQRADEEHRLRLASEQRAEVERSRAERFAARIRELGLEPEA